MADSSNIPDGLQPTAERHNDENDEDEGESSHAKAGPRIALCEGCIHFQIMKSSNQPSWKIPMLCTVCGANTSTITRTFQVTKPSELLGNTAEERRPVTPIEASEMRGQHDEIRGPQCDGSDPNVSEEYFPFEGQTSNSDGGEAMHTEAPIPIHREPSSGDDVQDNTDATGESVDLKNLEFCPEHSGKKVQKVCMYHKALCCKTCITLDHQTCKQHLVSLRDLGKDVRNGNIPLKLKSQMDVLKECISGAVNTLSQQLEDKGSTLMEDMDEMRAHLIKVGNQLVTKARSNYLNLKEVHKRAITSRMTILQELGETINAHISGLERGIQQGATKETLSIILFKIEQLKSLFQELSRNVECVDVKPSFSDDMDKILDALASIDVKFVIESKPYRKPISQCFLKEMPLIKIRRQDDRRQPFYRGLEHLPDGRLVAVDSNNKLCCLLDDDFKIMATIELSSWAADLAVIGKTEVHIVIALPDSKTLQIIKVDGTALELTKTIRFRVEPHSVSRITDACLAVGLETGIGIVDIDGSQIAFIDRDSTGREITFLSPDHILVDDERRRIYRSWFLGNAVFCMDYTGKVCFSLATNMCRPSSMTLDRDHNLYICSKDTHNIHQVSPEGRLMRAIPLGSHFIYPNTICYNPLDDVLTVADLEEGSQYVARIRFDSWN